MAEKRAGELERQNLLAESLLETLREIEQDLHNSRLTGRWNRKDSRHLRTALKRKNVPIVHLGSSLSLIRGQDIWRMFDGRGGAIPERKL